MLCCWYPSRVCFVGIPLASGCAGCTGPAHGDPPAPQRLSVLQSPIFAEQTPADVEGLCCMWRSWWKHREAAGVEWLLVLPWNFKGASVVFFYKGIAAWEWREMFLPRNLLEPGLCCFLPSRCLFFFSNVFFKLLQTTNRFTDDTHYRF